MMTLWDLFGYCWVGSLLKETLTFTWFTRQGVTKLGNTSITRSTHCNQHTKLLNLGSYSTWSTLEMGFIHLANRFPHPFVLPCCVIHFSWLESNSTLPLLELFTWAGYTHSWLRRGIYIRAWAVLWYQHGVMFAPHTMVNTNIIY